MQKRPSPVRGGWLRATAVISLGVLVCLTLGCWQINRWQQRRAANTFLLERLGEPPLRLDGGPLVADATDLRRAVVRGTYDFSQEMVLRNRTYYELPGVHVLTPLRIAGGDAAILVDRGWLPYELSAPEQRQVYQQPTDETEVRGVLRRSWLRPNSLSPADPPIGPDRPRLDAWFRVDLPRIQEQVPYPLLPVFLEEETPAGQPPRQLPRPDPDIELSEGSHLVYAVQWFAFAGILVLGYAWLYHRRTAGEPENKPNSLLT